MVSCDTRHPRVTRQGRWRPRAICWGDQRCSGLASPDRLALLARLVHPHDHRPAAVQIHTHVRRSTGPPLPEVLVERPRVLTRSDDPETGRTFFFVPAPPITPPMPSPPRRREDATVTPSHRITSASIDTRIAAPHDRSRATDESASGPSAHATWRRGDRQAEHR